MLELALGARVAALALKQVPAALLVVRQLQPGLEFRVSGFGFRA